MRTEISPDELISNRFAGYAVTFSHVTQSHVTPSHVAAKRSTQDDVNANEGVAVDMSSTG